MVGGGGGGGSGRVTHRLHYMTNRACQASRPKRRRSSPSRNLLEKKIAKLLPTKLFTEGGGGGGSGLRLLFS